MIIIIKKRLKGFDSILGFNALKGVDRVRGKDNPRQDLSFKCLDISGRVRLARAL